MPLISRPDVVDSFCGIKKLVASDELKKKTFVQYSQLSRLVRLFHMFHHLTLRERERERGGGGLFFLTSEPCGQIGSGRVV